MTKIEKVRRHLRDRLFVTLDQEFSKQFGRTVTTEWNIVAMHLVTYTDDEQPLTDEQQTWIGAYSLGYRMAMDVAKEVA